MKLSGLMDRLLRGGWGTASFLFGAILLCLFLPAIIPGKVLFSNDGPLGELMAACHAMPGRFSGCWADLNSVGLDTGPAAPGLTFILQWLLGPVYFSKFYAFTSLLLLGLGSWCFFRELGLSMLACVAGGMAMMLNSSCFSVACWGVAAHDLAVAMTFLAMAALARVKPGHTLLRLALAGFAVGEAVVEAADVGAILSLVVVLFMVFQTLHQQGDRVKNMAVGLGRLGVVTALAFFLAAQSVQGLIQFSIHNVQGTAQDSQTKADRWHWATQWSLPKAEVLGLVVPGLFGYRMDTPNGGNYWGNMGRDAAWDTFLENGSQGPPPLGFIRYTGGGNYVGALTALVGLWAVGTLLLRKNPVFDRRLRGWVIFYSGLAIVSLMLALGHYAPFYHLFYQLPYVSTIRNPTKFLYVFDVAMGVLFALGLDAMDRRYMSSKELGVAAGGKGTPGWLGRAGRLERHGVLACGALALAGIFAWMAYASHRSDLVEYLQSVRLISLADSDADFSIRAAGWGAAFLTGAACLIIFLKTGAFSGKRRSLGALVILVFLLVDLGRANLPWIVPVDYKEEYSSNPVLDYLRQQPYDQRVVLVPMQLPPPLALIRNLYKVEWLQHQFPFYDIQAFDMVSIPRLPEDLAAYQKQYDPTQTTNSLIPILRAWQLTNTRYMLGPSELETVWEDNSNLFQHPLKPLIQFDIVPKANAPYQTHDPGDFTVSISANGLFSLFEMGNMLPRACVYSHWENDTQDKSVLDKLFNPTFNPETEVIVDEAAPDCPSTNATDLVAAAKMQQYSPKDVVLQAQSGTTSILMLNDRYDPAWKVWVDGQAAHLLRCNFLMQGVQIPPGLHKVEFKFLPPPGLRNISLAGVFTALTCLVGLLMMVMLSPQTKPQPGIAPAPDPSPVLVSPRELPPQNQKQKSNQNPRTRQARRNGKESKG